MTTWIKRPFNKNCSSFELNLNIEKQKPEAESESDTPASISTDNPQIVPLVTIWRGREDDLMMSRETPRRFLPTVRKHMKRILMMREKEGEQMEDQVEVGIGYYDQRILFL